MEILGGAADLAGGSARRSALLRRLGSIALAAGDLASAQPMLERAVSLAEEAPADPALPAALDACVELHIARGQPERAQALHDQAEERAAALGSPVERARHLRIGARIHAARDQQAEALSALRQAVALLREGGPSPSLAETLNELGRSHAAKGDYDGAIAAYREAFEVYERLGDKSGLAEAAGNAGEAFYTRGDYERAREYYGRSLTLREEAGDRRGKANALNNLGLVHGMRNDARSARACFEKSLEILSAIGDEAGSAAALTNMSRLYEAEGRYAEALDASFRALEKRKRINNRAGIAFSYYRIGHIYRYQGELEKARGYAEKSLRLRKDLGDRTGIAHGYRLLGDIELARGNLFEAFRHFRQSLSSFESFGDRIGRVDLYGLMALTSLQVGMFDEAESYLARSIEIARENDLRFFVGHAMRQRGILGIERGTLEEAEADLAKAERIYRESRSRRDQAQVLLDRARLALDRGEPDRALEILDRAYAILEEIQVRDLSPEYFLLRGRAEIDRANPDLDLAERLLNRGFLEAREAEVTDLAWRLLHQLARLAERRERPAAAASAIRQARAVLDGIFEKLPVRFKETYFDLRERRAVQAFAERLADVATGEDAAPAPSSSPAPTPPSPEQAPPAAAPAVPPPGAGSVEPPPTARASEPAHEEVVRLRARNLHLERLQEITNALNSELVLDKVLEKITDATLEFVNAERGFIILRGEDGDRFHAARNLDGEVIEAPQDQISHSIAHEVMATGRPLIADDALSDERLAKYKSVRDLRLQSILCLPLRARDRVIGTLYLDNRFTKNAFSPTDVGVLETLCDQAAIAIENARLIEENLRRRAELEESYRKIAGLNRRLEEKIVRQEVALAEARRDLAEARQRVEGRYRFERIIGRSPRMTEIFRVLEKVAPTDLSVLIEGESGTGKELVAHAIHYQSPRRDKRLILENCGALTETLLESELFGHAKGAFTGAVAERKGLFELADGGTLLLDEVGDLSLDMQKKLLRVLQEGEIRRVGGKQTLKVDVRIVAASNRSLRALVAAGSFREDLYYRLNVIRVELPPLRERIEDLPLLAEHFLEEIAQSRGEPVRRLSSSALRALLAHRWPGNVRELKHVLERTVLLTTGETLEAEDLILEPIEPPGTPAPPLPATGNLRQAREAFVREYLKQALDASRGVIARAARQAGVSRESFHRMCNKYKIK